MTWSRVAIVTCEDCRDAQMPYEIPMDSIDDSSLAEQLRQDDWHATTVYDQLISARCSLCRDEPDDEPTPMPGLLVSRRWVIECDGCGREDSVESILSHEVAREVCLDKGWVVSHYVHPDTPRLHCTYCVRERRHNYDG